jgi:hypothetical protein
MNVKYAALKEKLEFEVHKTFYLLRYYDRHKDTCNAKELARLEKFVLDQFDLVDHIQSLVNRYTKAS